jgi:hypothetical protein
MHAVDADQQDVLNASPVVVLLRIGLNLRTCRSHQKPGADSSASQEVPHNLSLILGKRAGTLCGTHETGATV